MKTHSVPAESWRSIPAEGSTGLVLGDAGFEEVLFLLQIHDLAHPGEGIHRTVLRREADAFEPAVSPETLSGMGSADPGEDDTPAPTAVVAGDVRRTASATGVMDEIDLDASEITGNQELPKVLYIVPWQKSEAGELVGKPVNTLLDEVLTPIDRSEFIRRVDYYSDLYGTEEP